MMTDEVGTVRIFQWLVLGLLLVGTVTIATAQEISEDTQNLLDNIPACHDGLVAATMPDDDGCATEFDPYAPLVFFEPDDEGWFNRFWTGSCEEARGFCVGGIGWTETIDIVIERLPDEYDAYARNRLWAFGRAAGFNWSHGNVDIKEITTNDVRVWGNRLDRATEIGPLFDELAAIESAICERTTPDFFVGGYARGAGCLSHMQMITCDVPLSGTSVLDDNGCATEIDPLGDYVFIDEGQAATFIAFWTGDCSEDDCVFEQGWSETIEAQLALIQADYTPQMRVRWWALGRAIGTNWAEGTLSTDAATGWQDALAGATNEYDIRAVTYTIETEVCEMLGAGAIESYALAASCQIAS